MARMGLLASAMRYYPYIVHPITVLGVGIVVLIHHEWAQQDVPRAALWRRIGLFLATGLLALLPTGAYFLIRGVNPIAATQGNSWQMDALVASGLFIVAALMWVLWRRFDSGPLVPGAMQTLIAVTVPYIALSPIWNVSGHVIIALMPTLYLTLLDRTFWPTLLIPIVMVWNRIYLNAHTWAQSIGGLLIATAIVIGVYRLQMSKSLRSEPESTSI